MHRVRTQKRMGIWECSLVSVEDKDDGTYYDGKGKRETERKIILQVYNEKNGMTMEKVIRLDDRYSFSLSRYHLPTVKEK
jgi:hypothetical protein